MFDMLAARMRQSDINFRLLIPLMLSAAAVQAVVAIARITTSYRVVELDLPVIWLGIISTAYAILPALIALWLGRFIDRGHDALATWIGSVLLVVACAGLLVSGSSKELLLASTAVLGLGNLFTVVSQQILCVRCSGMRNREFRVRQLHGGLRGRPRPRPLDRRLDGRRREGAADTAAVRARARGCGDRARLRAADPPESTIATPPGPARRSPRYASCCGFRACGP